MSRQASSTGALLDPVRREARTLDAGTRAALERQLGGGAGDVVVHTGSASAALAESQHAAAFTVGRHVVFNAGRFDPGTSRGRALLAHELTHVRQQRSGGGDLDAGYRMPLSALTKQSGATESAASAVGRGSAPGHGAGSAAVGIARADKDEEQGWGATLKRAVRGKAMEALGTIESVPTYVAGAADSLTWIPYAGLDASDKVIDAAGEYAGLSKETTAFVKDAVPGTAGMRLARDVAKAEGLVDQVTGVPSLTLAVGKIGDAAEAGINDLSGVPKEEGFFTDRELSLLGSTIAIDVGLSFVAVEEVVLGLKVIGGAGVGKAIYTAIMANPSGFYKSKDFWIAVAQAALYLVGIGAAKLRKKILDLVVNVLSTSMSLIAPAIKLGADFQRPSDDKDRDKLIKADVSALLQATAQAIRTFMSHNKTPPELEGGHAGDKPPASKGGGSTVEPEGGGAAKPAQVETATTTPQQPAPTVTPKAAQAPTPQPQTKALPVAAAVPGAAPAAQPVAKVAPKPATKAAPKPVAKAAPKPVAKPAPKPAAKPKKADGAPAAPTAEVAPAAPAKKAMAAKEPVAKSEAVPEAPAKKSIQAKKPAAKSAEVPAAPVKKPKVATMAAPAKKAPATKKAAAKKPEPAPEPQAKAAVGPEAAPAKKMQASAPKPAAKKTSTPKKTPTKAKNPTDKKPTDKKSTKPRKRPANRPYSKEEVDAEVKVIAQRIQQLTKEAVTDPAAVEKIEKVYKEASDQALARLDDDKVVQEEQRRRWKGNQEAVDSLNGKKEWPRMPHEATVEVKNKDGSPAYSAPEGPDGEFKPGQPLRKELTSGGTSTPERRAEVGMNRANQESHTEAKAVQLPLKKGQTMTITGQYDPCDSCRGFMQRKADASGGTVVYLWMGGRVVFVPKAKP